MSRILCWFWYGHDWSPNWFRVEDWHIELEETFPDHYRSSNPIPGKGADPDLNGTTTYRERRCLRCEKLESIQI